MKNPETILFIEGKEKFIFINIKTKEEHREVVNSLTKFLIGPYIYHEIKAMTNIIFLKMNSIKDDDTIKEMKSV